MSVITLLTDFGTSDSYVAEVKAADNERIQSLLNRRPSQEVLGADEYLTRLTG